MTRLAASGYQIDHRVLGNLPREAFMAEVRAVESEGRGSAPDAEPR